MFAMHEVPAGHGLLTVDEVAAIFRVDRTTVVRWSNDALLRCIKLPNGRRRYRRADVEEFLQYAESAESIKSAESA